MVKVLRLFMGFGCKGFGFLLLGLLLQLTGVYSQNLISPTPVFEHYSSNHDLPDVRVRNLFQDSEGYLWVGTMNGTCKYDGYTFQGSFQGKLSQKILGSWAHAITEDAHKNLWFGTRDGISSYHYATEQLIDVKGLQYNEHPILAKGVTSLFCNGGEKLYIGTPSGLATYDLQSKRFEPFRHKLLIKYISAIIASENDWIWIATQDGVIHFNTRDQQLRFFPLNIASNPYGDRIWSMMETNQELLIATASDGLLKIALSPTAPDYGIARAYNNFPGSGASLDNLQIFDICRSANGDLWLATEHGLANITGPKGQERLVFYRNNPMTNKSISHNIAYKVLIDKDNNLWCGTEGGLNKLNLDMLPFNYYTFTKQDARDQVRGIFSSDGKNIWLGTANNGLFTYNTSTGTTQRIDGASPDASKNIRSLFVDQTGLWYGTLNGLYASLQKNKGTKATMKDYAIFAIIKDRKGNIWIGTNKGLSRVTEQGDTIHYTTKPKIDPVLKKGFVRFIYEDLEGRIWLGFENGGCGIFNAATEVYQPVVSGKEGSSLPVSTYISIAEYPRNVFWLGSALGFTRVGLSQRGQQYVFDVKNYNEINGLPARSVNSVLADGKGNLWLGTLKGMVKFNTSSETFTFFLQDIEFGGNASSRAPGGQLLFGANDGFVVFHPLQIPEPAHAPTVHFTSFRLLNKPVHVGDVFEKDTILTKPLAVTEEITLNYKNNVFTIGFVGLHFSNPEQNRYVYQLLGFDKDWVYTEASNRNVTYTNLDAGEYIFQVKAANSSGQWTEQPATIKLTILPPPWKTWWAKILYFIAFNALLFSIIWYLQVQSRQRHQLRFEQMEKEQIRKMNEMKTAFFTDISHEFRTPLSLIISPVEELMTAPEIEGNARIKMRMIYNNCKKLLSLINELMTFEKMEEGNLQLTVAEHEIVSLIRDVYKNFDLLATRNSIRFSLNTDVERLVMPFDKPKLEIVLNNLLSNAFKFTPPGGKIYIDLQLHELASASGDAQLKIQITDTGRGIPPDELSRIFERFFSQNSNNGTGVGLYLTKKIVELHQGQITAESEPGVKTRFEVVLPVQESYVRNLHNGPAEEIYQPDFVTTLQPPVSHIAEDKVVDPNRPVVLLVEDNMEVMDYLDMLFRQEYNIQRANNGVAALAYLEKEQPDLIISDVMMPEMDGITLCRKIKSSVETSHIQVILLTAKSTIDNKMEGLQTGADDYIAKPFHPEILRIKARNLIETRSKLIERYKTDHVTVPVNISENPLDKEFLQNVQEAIEANLADDSFGVEELGKAVFMSRSHLFRKLKALTGQNPLDLIYSVRLKKGLELLLERRNSISAIAYEVGFKSPSAFSASFKKQYGKTPSEYLNSLIEPEKS